MDYDKLLSMSAAIALTTGSFLLTATPALGAGLVVDDGAQARMALAQTVPQSWNYEIKDGRRIPKGNRVSMPDGSWREEIQQGKCRTVKEKLPAGEYKESRRCD